MTTFRFATPNDAPALAALIERAYRGPEAAGAWTSEADLFAGPRTSLDEVSELIADPRSRFLVAEEASEIAGCALLQEKGPGRAYFGMFAIDPGRQLGGLGKAVLTEAEERVRTLWRASAMELTVISVREALIEYYVRRGYAHTGETEPFPFDETTGELRSDFHLVVLRKPL